MSQKFTLALLLATCLGFYSCEKKTTEGIKPDYGTTGNPHPGAQTVTGTTTHSNPATQNTSLLVGGSGWSNPTCGSTFSVTLKGVNGNTDVTISFAQPAKSNTYQVTSTPSGSTSCAVTITNAPDQPAGIIWHGQSGAVIVNTTSASINASLSAVVCVQKNFGFPTVTTNGIVGCTASQ